MINDRNCFCTLSSVLKALSTLDFIVGSRSGISMEKLSSGLLSLSFMLIPQSTVRLLAMEVVSERLDKSKDFAGNLLQDAVLDGTEETVDYVTDFQAETEFECETEYRESMER